MGAQTLSFEPRTATPDDALVVLDLEARQVQRAKDGDAAAFRWLFDRDAGAVRRFLHSLLRDRDRADEATQETFVRAHRQLGSLRTTDRWRSWLFGVARRVSLEQLRRDRRDRGSLHAVPEQADRAPNPEAALIGRESDLLIERALEQLDEDRRAALLLRLDHGLDYDSIGEVLGWPLSKVKNEIHRARLALRAAIGSYVEGAS